MSASRGYGSSERSPRSGAMQLQLPPQEHASELVLLARFENVEDLVTCLELRRADGDLGAARAHDGDEACAVRQLERLDALAGGRRVAVDLHLDDLEVLAAELEQVDEIVLGHLVLDEGHDARGGAD